MTNLARAKKKATTAQDLRALEVQVAQLGQSVLGLTQALTHLHNRLSAVERHLAGDNVPKGMKETKSGLVVPSSSKEST